MYIFSILVTLDIIDYQNSKYVYTHDNIMVRLISRDGIYKKKKKKKKTSMRILHYSVK